MKKLFAFSMLMAMPASAAVVVNSPVQHQWSTSALKNGGFARCINPNGCRNAYAPYDKSVAGYGEIYQGVLIDGYFADASGPVLTMVVYRMGSSDAPYSGIYTRADDWQGVS